ncbi:unnamed protein product [Soboliphyme baturini]|uniref:Uncharacterized protein n=1 Tax=Soboliphyme baturini TaxID=241478 RepID=A0A183J8X1_9BILA|nr:unnamed protein product [Soboliphyme baturini]
MLKDNTEINSEIEKLDLVERETNGALCDKKINFRLREDSPCFHKSEMKRHEQQLNSVEMRMLRWMCGVSRKDHIRNSFIRNILGVAPISRKLIESTPRWFGHVKRKPIEYVGNVVKALILPGKKNR